MKDIMLKITGKQYVGEEAEEQMEFVTEGQLYEKGDSTYLIYDESEFSGHPGCKTMLKLKGETLHMKRIGKEIGYGMEMEFSPGERFYGKYQTPYGDIDMEVLTNRVTSNLTEAGTGNIDVDYHVSLEGLAEGRNWLTIEIS